MSRALSLPHEHGGYLTIVGAATCGVALAPARGPALAVGAVVAAAFFARAPVEQLTRGRGARFDPAAVALIAAVIAVGAALLAEPWRALAPVVAAAIVAASLWARRVRHQRATWFETIGMAALGASAGLVARVGGVALPAATAVAIVFAAHGGLAVALVRSEVRPRERGRARPMAAVVLGALALSAVAIALLGEGLLALALLPRALHALARLAAPGAQRRPSIIGARETVMLVFVILIVILA